MSEEKKAEAQAPIEVPELTQDEVDAAKKAYDSLVADGKWNPDWLTQENRIYPGKGRAALHSTSLKDFRWWFAEDYWTAGDQKATGKDAIEFMLENASDASVTGQSSKYFEVYRDRHCLKFRTYDPSVGASFITHGAAERASNFGRGSEWNGNVYSFPVNLNVNLGGKHFWVPDVWVSIGRDFDKMTFSQNWRGYDNWNFAVVGGGIEMLAYRDGNFNKPSILLFSVEKRDDNNPGDQNTRIAFLRDIVISPENPEGVIDEVNVKLARARFNAACEVTASDNMAGWRGRTDDLMKTLLKAPSTVTNYYDPPVDFDCNSFTGQGKDLYVKGIKTFDKEPQYVQSYILQNDTLTPATQLMKTSDWSWQHTDTFTYAKAQAWATKVGLKLTIEYAANLGSFINAAHKWELSFEEQFTLTETWTTTKTDTRTYSVPGQQSLIGPQQAVRVSVVMMKVKATGEMGSAAQLETWSSCTMVAVPENSVRGSATTEARFKAYLNLYQAAITLKLQSVLPSYTPDHPDAGATRTIHGVFVVPTLTFAVDQGSAGSVRFTPAKYQPVDDYDALDPYIMEGLIKSGPDTDTLIIDVGNVMARPITHLTVEGRVLDADRGEFLCEYSEDAVNARLYTDLPYPVNPTYEVTIGGAAEPLILKGSALWPEQKGVKPRPPKPPLPPIVPRVSNISWDAGVNEMLIFDLRLDDGDVIPNYFTYFAADNIKHTSDSWTFANAGKGLWRVYIPASKFQSEVTISFELSSGHEEFKAKRGMTSHATP